MHGGGLCMAGGACVVGLGSCVAGGYMHAGGRVWQGGMRGLEGVCGGGHAWQGGVRARYYEIRSMSGRYASYWNAFLFYNVFLLVVFCTTVKPNNFLLEQINCC